MSKVELKVREGKAVLHNQAFPGDSLILEYCTGEWRHWWEL